MIRYRIVLFPSAKFDIPVSNNPGTINQVQYMIIYVIMMYIHIVIDCVLVHAVHWYIEDAGLFSATHARTHT